MLNFSFQDDKNSFFQVTSSNPEELEFLFLKVKVDRDREDFHGFESCFFSYKNRRPLKAAA